MEQFGIIRALQTAATNNGWRFISGDRYYRNAELMGKIDVGEIVMTGFCNSMTPRYVNSQIDRITYSAEIMLGRKFDEIGDTSSLDETFIQKYDRRLEELAKLIAVFIASFSCEHRLTIQSANYQYFINVYDENLDFVGGTITFVDEEFKSVE